MTLDTSAALGTVLSVLGSGQFPGVDLGVGPMPGPPGDGGDLRRRRRELHRQGSTTGEGRGRVAVREVPRRARGAGEVGADRLHPDPPVGDRHARGAAALDRRSRTTRSRTTSSRPTTRPSPRRVRSSATSPACARRGDRRDGADDDERGRARGRARGSGEERRTPRSATTTRAPAGVQRAAAQRVTITQDALAPRPTVWARPTRAPATWRAPASPRSWCTSSTT